VVLYGSFFGGHVMTQTIEQTGKKWKAIQLLAALLIAVGVALVFFQQPPIICAVVIVVGLLSWLVGSIGAWWYHG